MKGIWIAAAMSATAAAAAALFRQRQRREDHKALKSEVGKWEDEGGNVPQVPTPSPAPTPEKSVPDGR